MEHTIGPSNVSTLDKEQDVNLQLNERREYSTLPRSFKTCSGMPRIKSQRKSTIQRCRMRSGKHTAQ